MDTLLYCKNGDKTIRIVDELAPDWKTIGRLLKFADCDLEVISKDHQSQAECCQQMLSMWLKGRNNDDRPRTWETLLHVIKAARWGTLAEGIQDIVFATLK